MKRIGAEWRTDEDTPRPTMGQEHGGNKLEILNIIGTESSDLIAAVLGWNSATYY